MVDPNPTAYLSSTGTRIHDSGYVVGFADSPGATIYIFDNSLQFVRGPLGVTQARAVTDLYRVVGIWMDPVNGQKPWTSRKGVETLLPVATTESGWTADANACGWVMGWSNSQVRTNYTMAGTPWKPFNSD